MVCEVQTIYYSHMESVRLLLEKTIHYFQGPFTSWHNFWDAVSGVLHAFIDLSSKIGWPYLLSSLLIAWVIFLRTKDVHGCDSFFEYIFPRDVYRHRSAVADYKYVAFELSTKLLFTAPLISGFSYLVYKSIHSVLPTVPGGLIVNPVTRGIVLTVAVIVITDLGFFISHYLMHHIPALWKFHELHHSAEVLTPLTVYRVHPMEDLVTGVVGGFSTAILGVFYSAAGGHETGILTIFGVNVILFGFLLFGGALRHSHVWLSYGPVMSKIFISPAQHQIHHSVDPKHWNKNYGLYFAVWDWIGKTLYVPRQHEKIQFGVPGYDPADYATIPRMYLLPFKKAGQVLVQSVGSLRGVKEQDPQLRERESEARGGPVM